MDKFGAWGNATTPGNDPDEIVSTAFARGAAWDFDESAGPNEYFQIGGTLLQQRVFHYPGPGGYTLVLILKNKKDVDSTQAPFGTHAEAQNTSGICIRQDTNNAASRFTRVTLNNSSGSSDMVNITTPIGSTPVNRAFGLVFSARDHATEFDYQLRLVTLAGGLQLVAEGDFNGAPNNVDAPTQGRLGVRGGSLSWYYTGEISEAFAIGNYNYGAVAAQYALSQLRE